MARDGDLVEVTAGDYRGDVAVWRQHDLIVRGIGDRPSLTANGASAEGKAIFVVRGDNVRMENLAFFGARVRDRNGAGIRLEKGRLEVVGCHFEGNENGILTNNDETIELAVDRALARGRFTRDLAQPGATALSTRAAGDAVLEELDACAFSRRP